MQTRIQSWLQAIVTMGICALASTCVVEDRNFDEDFARQQDDSNDDSDTSNSDTTDDETLVPSALCQDYCDKSAAVCTDAYELFKDAKSCLNMCANLELALQEAVEAGETPDAKNTIACRLKELEGVGSEVDDQCPKAAIASQSCGSPCETYCRLHPKICGEVATETTLDQAECERQCAAVPMAPSFSIDGNYSDDSIQCRLIHLATASINEQVAGGHCPHARLASPPKCGDMSEANCENYCNTLAVACNGELAQYASKRTCLKTCEALPPGMMADRNLNTIGCRHYHAYTALAHPEDHCAHAGPTTDGHCGSDESANCEAYCTLATHACASDFSEKYETVDECIAECLPLPGSPRDSGYPPLPPDGGSEQVVQYLILAATKVLGEEPGASCDDVFEPNFALRL